MILTIAENLNNSSNGLIEYPSQCKIPVKTNNKANGITLTINDIISGINNMSSVLLMSVVAWTKL